MIVMQDCRENLGKPSPPARVQAGKIVAIEGIDGAGKSTLTKRLSEHLVESGYEVICLGRHVLPELTRLWSDLVHNDLLDHEESALLSAADCAVAANRMVKPARDRGAVVLLDRAYYSHLVHYGLRGVPLERLGVLFSGAVEADLLVYLSVGVQTALNRMRSRLKPDFWEAGLDYRLGLPPGQAYRRFQERRLSPAEIEDHFREHQRNAIELFEQLLPADRTLRIDSHLDIAEVTARCVERLESLLR